MFTTPETMPQPEPTRLFMVVWWLIWLVFVVPASVVVLAALAVASIVWTIRHITSRRTASLHYATQRTRKIHNERI